MQERDNYDLILNVDSLTEMSIDVARSYLRSFIAKTNWFLSINHEEYANVRSLVFANALSSPLFNSKDYTKSFFEALQKIV